MSKLSILAEFFEFLGRRKKWWLMPIALVIVVLGAFLAMAHGSPLASFLYTLF